MKLSYVFSILVSSLILSLSSSAGESEPGFTDLLADGMKAFRGYKQEQPGKAWQVKDGVLSLTGKGGDLISREKFEDFDLRFEWKIGKGGNSGVFIGAVEGPGAIHQEAIEMQILGNEGYPDLGEKHLAGAVYGLNPAKREWAKPAGEWNTVRIVKKDNVAAFYFNGKLVGKHDVTSEEFDAAVAKTKFAKFKNFGKHAKGHIGFQDHGDSAGLGIRKLRIKRL